MHSINVSRINTTIGDLNAFRNKAELSLRRKEGWVIPKRGNGMNIESELDSISAEEINEAVGHRDQSPLENILLKQLTNVGIMR